MIIDVVWQVVSRYAVGKPSSFTEEFARYAMIWLVVLGAAYLNGQRAHLSMDYFVQKLDAKKQARRAQYIELLMLVFALVVMVIGGGNLVYTTLYLGQESPAMHIPLGYIYSIVPISGLLIVMYSVFNIFQLKSSL